MNRMLELPNEELMTTGEFARRCGVTVGTVKRWDAKGLVHPVRTAGGQRRFRESDVAGVLATGKRDGRYSIAYARVDDKRFKRELDGQIERVGNSCGDGAVRYAEYGHADNLKRPLMRATLMALARGELSTLAVETEDTLVPADMMPLVRALASEVGCEVVVTGKGDNQ